MKGVYQIRIWNNRVQYNLKITRNITVIKGAGASGKTTLVEMLSDWIYKGGRKSGVKCESNAKVAVFDERTKWESEIKSIKNTIIFIDEGTEYLYLSDFATAVEKSNNYIVIFSRSAIKNFHYSVDEVYELETIKGIKHNITSMKKRYENTRCNLEPDLIITEDSGLGKKVMDKIFPCVVKGAGGNGNIISNIDKYKCTYKHIFVIVDGANYGAFIEETFLATVGYDIHIYTPESFEYLVLNTEHIRRLYSNQLDNIQQLCDFSEYLTYERYYTALLQDLAESIGTGYNKNSKSGKLLHYLRKNKVFEGIKAQVVKDNFYSITRETKE